eukprot:GDKI01005220.1.p1 GENE.GDKI01005220.1~~GDKI01005220.1.p1  ORF type:complete len:160 (-),score=15.21 GDKI01005220.1:51-530(-)
MSSVQVPAITSKRLEREIQKMQNTVCRELKVAQVNEGKVAGLPEVIVQVTGAPGTVYEGETFHLRFRFTARYPFDGPEVVFVGRAPTHPHIYSCGHICLSILGTEWSPALSIESVCQSILSMMSSCTHKVAPENDKDYSLRYGHKSPKDIPWMYHDDKC